MRKFQIGTTLEVYDLNPNTEVICYEGPNKKDQQLGGKYSVSQILKNHKIKTIVGDRIELTGFNWGWFDAAAFRPNRKPKFSVGDKVDSCKGGYFLVTSAVQNYKSSLSSLKTKENQISSDDSEIINITYNFWHDTYFYTLKNYGNSFSEEGLQLRTKPKVEEVKKEQNDDNLPQPRSWYKSLVKGNLLVLLYDYGSLKANCIYEFDRWQTPGCDYLIVKHQEKDSFLAPNMAAFRKPTEHEIMHYYETECKEFPNTAVINNDFIIGTDPPNEEILYFDTKKGKLVCEDHMFIPPNVRENIVIEEINVKRRNL